MTPLSALARIGITGAGGISFQGGDAAAARNLARPCSAVVEEGAR